MATSILIKEKQKKTFDTLKGEFSYSNVMQTPKVTKVVISTGTGKIQDKAKVELTQERLAKIAGQKAAPRGAKKSIATFKVRQGDTVGFQVTLRGPRMEDFLNRFLITALPRTRDFRGVSPKAVDAMGNLTIGVPEHTIFPETADEELKDIFGLSVTIVTTAKNKKEARAFFEYLGIPFKKEKK